MLKAKEPQIVFNPEWEHKASYGYRHVRLVENASRGLRFVGYADEVAAREGSRAIEHRGWYTDEDAGEVLRGVVYQLPSRDEPLYVYGYARCGDDYAVLSFDPVPDKLEAARFADRFAELAAESEREYQDAWHAGRRCDDIAEEIKATRHEALVLGEEMRAARRANINAPTICATLRDRVRSLYLSIQKMRRERAELHETFGRNPGFAEG